MSRFSCLATLHEEDEEEAGGDMNHVQRLSSIDQGSERVYNRLCAGFACDDGIAEELAAKLATRIKRTVYYQPILGGHARLLKIDRHTPAGCMEFVVTEDMAKNFKVTIKRMTEYMFRPTFKEVMDQGAPAELFVSGQLTPIRDAASTSSEAFAAQISIVRGGLIVGLYLHHALSDQIGLQCVIYYIAKEHYLPSGCPPNDILKDLLYYDSSFRDRLSGARASKGKAPLRTDAGYAGVPLLINPSTAHDRTHVFFIDVPLLKGALSIIHQRLSDIRHDYTVRYTLDQVLYAFLWQSVTRAAAKFYPNLQHEVNNYPLFSTISIPVNFRRIMEPPLEDNYFGNATFYATARTPAYIANVPIDPGSLSHMLQEIRPAIDQIKEDHVRSSIASIHASVNVHNAALKPAPSKANLTIVDQSNLDLNSAHLGLGLGPPSFTRRLSREKVPGEVVLHPPTDSYWEVTMTFGEQIMSALLGDTVEKGFMQFVRRVA